MILGGLGRSRGIRRPVSLLRWRQPGGGDGVRFESRKSRTAKMTVGTSARQDTTSPHAVAFIASEMPSASTRAFCEGSTPSLAVALNAPRMNNTVTASPTSGAPTRRTPLTRSPRRFLFIPFIAIHLSRRELAVEGKPSGVTLGGLGWSYAIRDR